MHLNFKCIILVLRNMRVNCVSEGVFMMYDMYKKLKKDDSSLLYLFKCGSFYIFLGDDAEYISKITTLKKVKFSKESYKCGFPLASLDTYLNIFNELGLDIKVIDNNDNNVDKIINKLKSIDVDNISGVNALCILKNLRDLL